MAGIDGGAAHPPTGLPSAPPTGPPRGPSHRRRKWVLAIALLAVLALTAGIVAAVVGGDDDSNVEVSAPDAGGEIFLQAASDVGPDPFTASTASDAPSSTVPSDTPVTLARASGKEPAPTAPLFGGDAAPPSGGTTAINALSGATPGLYGGTLNQSSCDQRQMIAFLTQNPDKAQAWAGVQGIEVDDLPDYIDELTPVLLRGDTRVTNYGFVDGQATEHQDILQAGTAVLVDEYGVPRARCACGNPLLPPRAVSTTPSYQGTPWTGFNPGNVTVVQASPRVINIITVINVTNGKPFGRPTGGRGGDRRLPGEPGRPGSRDTTTTLPLGGPPPVVPPPAVPPPAVPPPAVPPPAVPPPAPPADFVLVSSTKQDGELASTWTTNKDAGTATQTLNPVTIANYSWTVPQRISPGGTSITWGGQSVGNLAVLILPRGEGLAFGRSDLSVETTAGPRVEKSTIITPTATTEVKLIVGMGYGPTFTYTYRR